MSKQIEVYGNSNSIMKSGWLSFLKVKKQEWDFKNFSIGGSPSPTLLNQSLLSRAVKRRIAIIEPCVIDHCETWQDKDELLYYAENTIRFLKKAGPVFVLGLPRYEKHISSPSQGQRVWQHASEKLNAIYIDGSALIDSILSNKRVSLDEIWIDSSGHFSDVVQESIASKILEVLEGVSYEQIDTCISNVKFFNILEHDCKFSSFESFKIKTSLIEEEFLDLSNKEISFDERFNELALHGIKLNYQYISEATSLLHFNGSNVVEYKLYNEFAKNMGKPLVMFKKLYLPLSSDSRLLFKTSSKDENIQVSSILMGPRIEKKIS